MTPVVTDLGHLAGSNVCSKLHENWGILKPISLNFNMGILNFMKTQNIGYILKFPALFQANFCVNGPEHLL